MHLYARRTKLDRYLADKWTARFLAVLAAALLLAGAAFSHGASEGQSDHRRFGPDESGAADSGKQVGLTIGAVIGAVVLGLVVNDEELTGDLSNSTKTLLKITPFILVGGTVAGQVGAAFIQRRR